MTENPLIKEFDKYNSMAKRFAGKIMGFGNEYLEDAVCDAIMNAITKFDQYDPAKAKFSTWFLTIVRNNAYQSISNRKKFVSIDNKIFDTGAKYADMFSDEEDLLEAESLDLDETEMKKKTIEVNKALEDVFVDQIDRDLWMDCYVNKPRLKYTDLAEKYDVNIQFVKTRLNRSTKRLKKMLGVDPSMARLHLANKNINSNGNAVVIEKYIYRTAKDKYRVLMKNKYIGTYDTLEYARSVVKSLCQKK